MQMPQPSADVLARKARIVERLRAVLSEGAVIDDAIELKAYECDGLAAYVCGAAGIDRGGFGGDADLP